MTKTPLYPKGFQFTDADLTDLIDATHPTVMPLENAMDIMWADCQTEATFTITVHDFPTSGDTTVITADLDGLRYDVFGDVILADNPRGLIGVEHAKNYSEDYAAPTTFTDQIITGQAFGPDNTYQGTYTFSGLMYFNRENALPNIDTSLTVTCSNGAVFQITVTEPGNPQKKQGNYLTIDGQSVMVWFAWSGAAIPATHDPDMTVSVTTTETFNWPS